MGIPRIVAKIVSEHVTLELEGIDRMYLNVYCACNARQGWRGFPVFAADIGLPPAC